MLRKAKGSQIEKNQSYSCISDRDLTFGKVLRETLFSIDLGVGGEEGDSSEGEKKQSPNPFPDGVSGRFETQLGRETKSQCRTPNTPGETSSTSELEVEGDDSTRTERSVSPQADSSGKLEETWTRSVGQGVADPTQVSREGGSRVKSSWLCGTRAGF